MSSIAFDHGFFPETLWNLPANAKLKSARSDLNILEPGDVVIVPDKRLKSEARATDQSHRFLRKGVPAMLRLTLEEDDEALANQPFTLTIDGSTVLSGSTDANGSLAVAISPIARHAKLLVGMGDDASEFDLRLGSLRPIEFLAGVQARLDNLGYHCGGETALGPHTEAALCAFQADHGLAVSGQPDDPTRARLLAEHQS